MNEAAAIRQWGRVAFAHGLLYGASGNLSIRRGERIWITRSGSWLGFLTPRDVISFRRGGPLPVGVSMETALHLAGYAADAGAQCILHSQPLASTLLACRGRRPALNLVPESMYYVRRVALVPYAHPGSAKLAALVGKAAGKADLIMLRHHGLVALGATPEECLLKTIAFDFACRLAVEGNGKLPALPEKVRRDLQRQLAARQRA
ncbi:MAG TPA: class II aldolase/adducin family protein [bacterium]|nr:class II aldolase/adducin family protein [bacterium]